MIYFQNKSVTLHCADALERLVTLPSRSVQCVVTSPPYYGHRDYEVDGQIGLESFPAHYIGTLGLFFNQVWRVLKDDGTLWLNIGDSYSRDKNLLGIPWQLAFELKFHGWILRSDIIWSKTNPMPESVKDRPTRAHEHLFLFSKQKKYYFDAAAIREPLKQSSIARLSQDIDKQAGSVRANGGRKTNGPMKAVIRKPNKQRGYSRPHTGFNNRWDSMTKQEQQSTGANKRSVWSVATQPCPVAHPATYPEKLIEPCILAGSRPGDVVLDPFWGAGTTGVVAVKNKRRAIGIELNPDYCKMSVARLEALR